MQPDLVIEMLPTTLFQGAPTPSSIHETCTATEVADDDPQRLVMSCPDGLETLEWRLEVSPPSLSLAGLFSVDQAVDLRYFAGGGGGPADSLPHQWAILRAPDDAAPLLVVANGELPGVYGSTLSSEVVPGATCDGAPSCSISQHRSAVEFTLEDIGSSIVFDHNEGELGPYHIRVGKACVDDEASDVGSLTRYEFIIVRSSTR
jgi:hypothetical protein